MAEVLVGNERLASADKFYEVGRSLTEIIIGKEIKF